LLGVKDLKEERMGQDIREDSYIEGLHKFCIYASKITLLLSIPEVWMEYVTGRDETSNYSKFSR